MKEYPEPIGRWLDIAEIVLVAMVAVGLCVNLYFAVCFAAILLGGAQ